jgi:hypothetical protein
VTPFKSSGSGLYTFTDPRKPTPFAKPRAAVATKPTTYAWAKPTPTQVKARGAMTIADLGGPKSVSATAKKATTQTLRDTSNDLSSTGKRIGGGILSAAGKATGQTWAAQQAALAAQTPKYNYNWESQVKAYADAMTGMTLASSNMDLASATAEADYARATASARLADIDAGYNAAMDQLKNQLAQNGDQKKFLADKLKLDMDTAALKDQAVNDALAANARQPGLIAQQRESVEKNYGMDVNTLGIQETQVGTGHRRNVREESYESDVSGAGMSSGRNATRQAITEDYTSAMGLIAEDRNRLTQKRIDNLTTLDEADKVIGDRTKEYENQLAQLDVGKKLLVLGYWSDINEIDHRQRAQQISAKEAADHRAAAKKAAAAETAKAAAIERAAQVRHQEEMAAINAQKDTLRNQAANSGMFGQPPPPAPAWGVTAANRNAAQIPLMPAGRTYVPTAKFGEQGNPFTPVLTKSWASTNPLGIDDNEYKKIGIVSQWESGGNPQVAWQKFVDYVNFFKWAQSEQERDANIWYGR